jgi:mono/diheme cytochrome c family protein
MALLGAVAVSCVAVEPRRAWDDDTGLAEAGRQVAVEQCSSCHAIDRDTMSPHSKAPPMSSLLNRYDPDMLANDLIEGIRVGHDDMPRFDFNIMATDALIAYLKSIER